LALADQVPVDAVRRVLVLVADLLHDVEHVVGHEQQDRDVGVAREPNGSSGSAPSAGSRCCRRAQSRTSSTVEVCGLSSQRPARPPPEPVGGVLVKAPRRRARGVRGDRLTGLPDARRNARQRVLQFDTGARLGPTATAASAVAALVEDSLCRRPRDRKRSSNTRVPSASVLVRRVPSGRGPSRRSDRQSRSRVGKRCMSAGTTRDGSIPLHRRRRLGRFSRLRPDGCNDCRLADHAHDGCRHSPR